MLSNATNQPRSAVELGLEDKVPVEDLLLIHIPEGYWTRLGQKLRVWLYELPKRFPKLVVYVTLCQEFWSDLKILKIEIKNASTKSSKLM